MLAEAGAADTDMLFAVTASDETNLVACKVGHAVFNIPTRIARIRSTWFERHPELLEGDCFSVSHAICPEQIVTEYIERLIEFPEALEVVEFAGGKVDLVAVRAVEGGTLVRHPLRDLEKLLPTIDAKVAGDLPQRPAARARRRRRSCSAGDEVFILADAREHPRGDDRAAQDGPAGAPRHHRRRRQHRPAARARHRGADEREGDREPRSGAASSSPASSPSALVLNGDVSNEDLLGDENVDETDLFVSVTNDDEANIMSALLAKRMGARRVIALINRRAYGDLMHGGQIDIAISPAQATLGSLLEHVRRGDVAAVHSIRRGRAEAIELIAHGDRKTSRVVGRRIREVDLPPGATIVGIIRGEQVIVAEDDGHVIEPDDHVLVFLTQQRMIPKLEKLFEVAVGFF